MIIWQIRLHKCPQRWHCSFRNILFKHNINAINSEMYTHVWIKFLGRDSLDKIKIRRRIIITCFHNLLLFLGSGGVRWPSDHWRDDARWKERLGERWSETTGATRASAGMKVKGGGSQSRPVRWAGRRTTGDPQAIGLPEGCRSHVPRCQIHEMCGTAEEAGHRVVSGMAVGACGVIGPH